MAIVINQLEVSVEAPPERSGERTAAPASTPARASAPAPLNLDYLEERRALYRARVAAH